MFTELLKVIPFQDPVNKITLSIAKKDYKITHLLQQYSCKIKLRI